MAIDMHRLIDSVYNEYDRPDKFSVDKFFKEILLSYRLLFGALNAGMESQDLAPSLSANTALFRS
jgi:hypothetical protein